MQINLEFMSVLAEFEQNCHLPEHMMEWVPTYTYFLYPVISCDKIWTTFFTFSRIPFHILLRKVSEVHIKFVSQYSAKIKIIRSSGKMAVVVQGFTNPRLQVLQAMSKFYGTWVCNFPYVSVLIEGYCLASFLIVDLILLLTAKSS